MTAMSIASSPATPTCTDPVALDEWHPISSLDEMSPGVTYRTMLLGDHLGYARSKQGEPTVWRRGDSGGDTTNRLPVRVKFGYVWTTLGQPDHDVFDIPECDEPDRRRLSGGSILVATSAPRAVENFLDMGHFPYVHTGILGAEPRTEVVDYDVETTTEQVLATRCRFYQPQAAALSTEGQVSEYIYRVPHPYCVMLYKSNPTDPTRMDVIALFNQPMTEESVRAHNFLCLIDDVTPDAAIRRFQQTIFGQDKPILENQWPRRLPLDPRAETPIRADKSAIHYRRWLTAKGLTYAVIPAGAR
jgi:phenylpropionate dioxygenase-like ring-hydroxylating dioxygenase large terminal subunit